MAEGDRAAVGVHPAILELFLPVLVEFLLADLEDGQARRGEGLVEFDVVEVFEPEAGAAERQEARIAAVGPRYRMDRWDTIARTWREDPALYASPAEALAAASALPPGSARIGTIPPLGGNSETVYATPEEFKATHP